MRTDDSLRSVLNSTEIYHTSKRYFVPGPTMPTLMRDHCMVRVNKTTILFIEVGGEMYFYDIPTETFGDIISFQDQFITVPGDFDFTFQ